MTRHAPSTNARAAGRLTAALLLIATLFATSALAEPTLQLRVSRGPYYSGVPMEVHVHATGFDAEPQPTCQVDGPASGDLSLIGVVPQFNSSVQIVNGRVTRTETATFVWQYRFTPATTGSHSIGPFNVEQAGVTRATERHSIEVEDAPLDPKVGVKILVPEEPAYVGQQLPIRIELWLDAGLQDQIRGYALDSELFHRDDTFRFLADERPEQGQQTLEIDTQSGPRALPAAIDRRRANDRDYLVISAERTLVPLKSGEFDVAPATISVEAVTRWQRDLFGGRRPAASAQLYGRDEARRLVVRSAPAEGRPDTFSGAIGRGFSVEVTADRSVVQLGDPITLTVTIRGDGNLTSVGPPRFDADAGLDPSSFRLPDVDVSGEIRGESKVFAIPVRVLSDSVREIPALAYTYFDPESEEYKTTHSRPIALSVRPAEVISAADVVNAAPSPGSPDADTNADASSESEEGRRGSFTLTGADLSIETDPDRLLRHRGSAAGLQIGLYAASLCVMALAVGVRRRGRIDPVLRSRRQTLETQKARMTDVRGLAPREAAGEIAGVLRAVLASAPELRRPELDGFLARCDALLYSPDHEASAESVDDLAERAEDWLSELQREIG